MKRRPYRAVSSRERRDADLFFADLMELDRHDYDPAETLQAHREASLFFEELLRGSTRQLAQPSVAPGPELRLRAQPVLPAATSFAEQPAPAAAALPTPIATKWAGIDRRAIPQHNVAGHPVGDTAWMGTLIDNSNLRFT